MLIELAKAVSFLLALCFLQSFIVRRWRYDELTGRICSGVLFGCVAIIGMLVPIEVAPGHIADARSVVLSIAGLFGGPVAGLIAGVIAGGYRLWLGGGGAPVGVAAVIVFVLLGLAYRYGVQRGWLAIGFLQLLAFGLIVHLAMVALFTFLPEAAYRVVMDNMALPMVLSFTPATALLGMLLYWINSQVETEIALAKSERRFKDIAENTSDWIWEMGPDLRFTYFSSGNDEEVGYDIDHPLGQKRGDSVPQSEFDENPEKWAAHFADLEARRAFRNFEYVVKRREGGLRYIRTSGSPVFGPDGTFLGYRGAGSDITAEKLAENKLRESEAHYRDLFEGMEVGIFVRRHDSGGVFANPCAAQLFGYDSVDALLTVQPGELVAPHDRERISRITQQLYASSSEAVQYEADGLRKDGSQLPLQVYARHISWDGEAAIMRTYIDLTERKRAEEQLRQAQKMEAVGQLTGGVAHDFNNILTAVTGNLNLAAKETDQGSVIGKYIDRALAAAWRAARLTERLLTFSRVQALRPRVIDTFELIEGMTDLLQRTMTESIRITCKSEPGLWRCRIDPNQLESAILNLAINARDAMPDGGSLTIETGNVRFYDELAAARSGVVPGEYVVVAVTDTGAGMSQQVLRKAFEPFFTSKGPGKGSGLGLSMVYGFVNQSGGHVTIDSGEGEGTSVKLYLPRTEAPAEDLVQQESKAEIPKAQGEIVLMVEDDPDVRELNTELLSSLGYNVIEAVDGDSALSMVKETERIDLLFTDLVMPGGMKGTELATEIMRIRPEIAVLITSGYTDGTILTHEQTGQDFNFLMKPYRVEELARKVRSVIDAMET